MLRRLTHKTIETLEFRGVLVVLAAIAALIFYLAFFSGHRPPPDNDRLPSVAPGPHAGPATR